MHRSTRVIAVDPQSPQPEAIAQAAQIVRSGGLVAFPTETVYGLGANALDKSALAKIFQAKGRPPNNPLIVHVARPQDARELAAEWPACADRLVERFWPGPLSLVVAKRPIVPDLITAGAATVALRMPAHRVALDLLVAAGVPIAAPSANRSMEISPTSAAHVLKALQGQVDLILDAGPTPGGLESTVIDVTRERPVLLRPGLISRGQIEEVVGAIDDASGVVESTPAARPSPGMLERHYAPRAKLRRIVGNGREPLFELLAAGKRVAWLRYGNVGEPDERAAGLVHIVNMPKEPSAYAAALYAALHACDDAGAEYIVVELPPHGDAWAAVHDRLRRASAK
jgi:L-threonylcarbamoyladenylate synthase